MSKTLNHGLTKEFDSGSRYNKIISKGKTKLQDMFSPAKVQNILSNSNITHRKFSYIIVSIGVVFIPFGVALMARRSDSVIALTIGGLLTCSGIVSLLVGLGMCIGLKKGCIDPKERLLFIEE